MAKKIERWECATCHTTFETEKSAMNCEKGHIIMDWLQVIGVSFISNHDWADQYPDYIMLENTHQKETVAIYRYVHGGDFEYWEKYWEKEIMKEEVLTESGGMKGE